MPVGTGSGGQWHRRIAAHTGELRFGADGRDAALRIGGEGEQHRAVVQQQRIGHHVVRPQRLAVEIARVLLGRDEGAAVQHDVAADPAHAELLQALEHQPDALEHQLRVAAALDDEVALEHAVADRALQPHRRGPAPGRPQHVERRVGGEQLHQRRRVQRPLALPGQARPGRAHFLHHRDQRVVRQLGLVQRRLDLQRQRPRGGGAQGKTQERAEYAGRAKTTPSPHEWMIARPPAGAESA